MFVAHMLIVDELMKSSGNITGWEQFGTAHPALLMAAQPVRTKNTYKWTLCTNEILNSSTVSLE